MTAPLTLVLPYFNERDFIGATLRSLGRQDCRQFSLVLVDNASTDTSTEVARAVVASSLKDIGVRWLIEPRPGKIHALATGTRAVESPFVGTIDADTIYPPEYVGRALELLRDDSVAAAIAFRGQAGRASAFPALQAALFPRKCHGGGYGQAFRTEVLRRAGGFDAAVWPWVLEDHEIMARVGRFGRLAYSADHWCEPSNRRQDRGSVNWTLGERVLYKLIPAAQAEWFFHRFLSPRFARRGLANINLRDQAWSPKAPPA